MFAKLEKAGVLRVKQRKQPGAVGRRIVVDLELTMELTDCRFVADYLDDGSHRVMVAPGCHL